MTGEVEAMRPVWAEIALGVDAAAAAAGEEPVAVHVEVDTGFGRLGVRFDEAAASASSNCSSFSSLC